MNFKKIAAVIALSFLAPMASAAATVGFTPSAKSVLPGETFTLTLHGSGFDVTPGDLSIDNVTGFQGFGFSFDASRVEVVRVQIDALWWFRPDAGTLDNVAGTLTGVKGGVFPATTSDSFDLLTVTLKSLGAGDSKFSVETGVFAGKVAGFSGKVIVPAFQSATIHAVPEPSEWALMLTGLALIGSRLRKQR